MQLDRVPYLLQLLVDDGVISASDQKKILDAQKEPANKGIRVGELVTNGHVAVTNLKTGEPLGKLVVDAYLWSQAAKKCAAAAADFETLVTAGKPFEGSRTKAFWRPPEDPEAATDSDAVINLANLMQNLVVLVNEKPALAQDKDILGATRDIQSLFLKSFGEALEGFVKIEASFDPSASYGAATPRLVAAFLKATEGRTDVTRAQVETYVKLQLQQAEVGAGLVPSSDYRSFIKTLPPMPRAKEYAL